jgi:uncharacterized protein YllA (UPF0747 family)
MVVNKKLVGKMAALHFAATDFFKKDTDLMTALVKRETTLQLDLEKEKSAVKDLYTKIQSAASLVDSTLQGHVSALHAQTLKRIELLEKKMLKAEKLKFEAQQRQIKKIKEALFANDSLQERIDNILPYYSVYGKGFIDMLYRNSRGLQQEFCIVTEN